MSFIKIQQKSLSEMKDFFKMQKIWRLKSMIHEVCIVCIIVCHTNPYKSGEGMYKDLPCICKL